MEGLAEQIAAYHAVPYDEKGEAWGKVQVIERLEEHLGVPEVLAFFLGILGDTSEYDMARCHLLKWFEGDPARGTPGHAAIGGCIADTLRREDDWLVKSWLSRAADAYCDVPDVIRASAERLLDSGEDSGMRCGFAGVLQRAGPSEEVLNALRQAAAGADDVAAYVRTILSKWCIVEPGAVPDRGSIQAF
jgi:hypothetical protein